MKKETGSLHSIFYYRGPDQLHRLKGRHKANQSTSKIGFTLDLHYLPNWLQTLGLRFFQLPLL